MLVGLGTGAAQAAETADWLPFKVGNGVVEVGCTWSNGCDGDYHGDSAKAIDFIAALGTPVYAAGPGTVVASNDTCHPTDSPGCSGHQGRFVEIEHPDGRHSRYLHLSDAVVTSGPVKRGDLIGKVGNSGGSPVAHLHYEERVNGTKVDPGQMSARRGSNLVQYPDTLGYNRWAAVPAWSDKFVYNDSYEMGTGARLMGDVNGDGKSDAVVMFRDTGTAMVALSTGGSFATPSSWAYLHTVGADKYFLADVNGDNMSDLVAFWQSTGKWYVSLSSGSGFWPETDWATGHGVGTAKQWVTNVNNDGMADLVTYDAVTGDWHVSSSSGSGFWAPVPWIGGHGAGSASQEVADFTGDGKADAGVWFTNGNWYVAASNGSSFSGYTQWSASHGLNSGRRLVGDVSGDNKDDAAYFFASNGHWDVGTSSGSGFWAPTAWAHGHGTGTTEQFLAKVNGDNMADVVTFDRVTGDWYVSASSGTGFWAPALWMSGHGANS